jgi:hypothetical protein
MERLFFACPVTGRYVDVGIETEIVTLLRIKTKPVRAKCTACGQWHVWPVKDALPKVA